MPPPVKLPDVTIANGQTASPELDFTSAPLCWVAALGILAPATLPETVTLFGCEVSGGTFHAVQSGGADVTFPADKATVIDTIPFPFLMFVAGAAVGGDRVFKITGREDPLR